MEFLSMGEPHTRKFGEEPLGSLIVEQAAEAGVDLGGVRFDGGDIGGSDQEEGEIPAVENEEEPVIKALADHRSVVDPVEPGALPSESFQVLGAHPSLDLGDHAESLLILS